VSNTDIALAAGNSAAIGDSKHRWQIRIQSREPHLINDSEILYETTMRPVLSRCYTLVRRTSYMVGQPNREVLWAVDRWNWRRGEWQTALEGKSRLRKGAGPS
jgi:hypothetical protein